MIFFTLLFAVALLISVSGFFIERKIRAAEQWGIHCAEEAVSGGFDELETTEAIQRVDSEKKFLGIEAYKFTPCVEHFAQARVILKTTQIFRNEMEGLKEILEIVKETRLQDAQAASESSSDQALK
jgi:hypothetical protein